MMCSFFFFDSLDGAAMISRINTVYNKKCFFITKRMWLIKKAMTACAFVVSNVLFLCLFQIPSISGPLPNDDIAIIHQRVLELVVWPTKENIPATVQDQSLIVAL